MVDDQINSRSSGNWDSSPDYMGIEMDYSFWTISLGGILDYLLT